MPERKNYDQKLVNVGEIFRNKRLSLGKQYFSRENFIHLRSQELFNSSDWISIRHLSNIENGKNWISIEKFLLLAAALEQDPIDLFEEIITTYKN